MKGKLIFLNGVTSTGKSTVADCISAMSREIFYTSSNDIFHSMVPWNHFEGRFWSLVAHTITAQYHAVRGLLDGGFSVIIDGMFLDLPEYREQFGKTNYELFCNIFSGYEYTTANLICAPEELRRRNLVRGNRGEYQSDEQLAKMTPGLEYDLTLDVMKLMPEECAEMILEKTGIAYNPLPQVTLEKYRKKTLSSILHDYDAEVTCTVSENSGFIRCSSVIENTITVRTADDIEKVKNELLGRGYLPYHKDCPGFTLLERYFRGERTGIVRIVKEDSREYTSLTSLLGQKITVTVDRPLGSAHPRNPDLIYRVNYGFIPGTLAEDGSESDAYILGINEPIGEFTGYAAAVLHRFDDCEEKLIVLPDGITMQDDEILSAVSFVEQFFDTVIYIPKKA